MRTRSTARLALGLLAAAGLAGCTNTEASRSAAEAAPVMIDSMLPIPEELARFQATLAEAPTVLDGAASREELVRRYVTALESSDTAEIRRLALNRSEFGYLYYPESRFTRPPYELPPALLWFQIENPSSRSVARALNRFKDREVGYLSHTCEASEAEGPNTIWSGCRVLTGTGSDTMRIRLFGQILERDGSFKFISLANSL